MAAALHAMDPFDGRGVSNSPFNEVDGACDLLVDATADVLTIDEFSLDRRAGVGGA